jgi:hypothetical protein
MSENSNVHPDPILEGWTPIIGALSIWFGHFMIAWGSGEIWPHQPLANAITIVATLIALAAQAWLFLRLRAAEPTGDHTCFSRRFGLGSVFFATVATLFNAAPTLIGSEHSQGQSLEFHSSVSEGVGRYRGPYNLRHSSVTWNLMTGKNSL